MEALYGSFSDYLAQYEAATDALIADGFLLSGFKDAYMQVARDNAAFFPRPSQCGLGDLHRSRVTKSSIGFARSRGQIFAIS